MKTRKKFAKSLLWLSPTGLVWGAPPHRSKFKRADARLLPTRSGRRAGARSVKAFLEMTMTKPTKSKADLLALLVDDIRQFGHDLLGSLRGGVQEVRRRLWDGSPEVLEEATKPKTKPDLLALLEDDIRQCAGAVGALFGGLKRLRGGEIRPALTTGESAVSAQDPTPQA